MGTKFVLAFFLVFLVNVHSGEHISPNASDKSNHSSAGNESEPIIKEDPIAEVLEHDTMVFFAVLFMLCKFYSNLFFCFEYLTV